MSDMQVYKAISAVQKDLATEGITKDHKNSQQGYNFRGIDDVYNALAPILSKHGLCILPRIISREMIERQTKTGNALFYVTVEAEFDFVCAEDGSKHTVKTYGEAMDSADKATNKAMSAAYKYAAFQSFCIPTEGDNDADKTTHEVKPKETAQRQPAKQEPTKTPPATADSETVKKLKDVLLTLSAGDQEAAEVLLQDLSFFEKDDKSFSLKWFGLEKANTKWVASTYGRAKSKLAELANGDDVTF